MRIRPAVLPVVLTALLLGPGAALADTRETVLERGVLRCGVAAAGVGVDPREVDTGLEGLFVEFCGALGVALLGDAAAVDYLPLTPTARVDALRGGEVDLVVGPIVVTEARDAEGIDFAPVLFFDGALPLAPMVREGDDAWHDLVAWVAYALIEAEAQGVSAEVVRAGGVPERFVRYDRNVTGYVGLEPGSLLRMLGQIGNYGEIYARQLGGVRERGANRPVELGGRLFAPPAPGP